MSVAVLVIATKKNIPKVILMWIYSSIMYIPMFKPRPPPTQWVGHRPLELKMLFTA